MVRRKQPSRPRRQLGVALVLVLISLTAVGGIVAALYIISGDERKTSNVKNVQSAADSFANSVMGLCPLIIDAALGVGDFGAGMAGDITDLTLLSGPLRVNFVDAPRLAETISDVRRTIDETRSNNLWSADYTVGALPHRPNVIVAGTWELSARVDIDTINVVDAKAGNDTEFGTAGDSTLVLNAVSEIRTYRCSAEIANSSGSILRTVFMDYRKGR